VKEIYSTLRRTKLGVDDIIKNGVKYIKTDYKNPNNYHHKWTIEGIIKNGVKVAKPMEEWVNTERIIDEVVKDGVKKIKTPGEDGDIVGVLSFMEDNDTNNLSHLIDDVIENGVKEVNERRLESMEQRDHYVTTIEITHDINDAIENGVKEIKELPDKSGELKGYGDYYHRQENWTKPHTDYVKEVIEDHYHHMGRVEGIIRNTDKDGI
jgi:hypothetical protein